MQTALMKSVRGTGEEICVFQRQFEMAELTQEGFSNTVDEWSSSKWFIRSPVSAHIRMERRQNTHSFGIVLKSMFEQRYITRDDEPYFGGELCTGEIPPKWSVIVPPPGSYTREKRYVRIFADEQVVSCYECNGTGKIPHDKCNGTGRLACPNRKCRNGMVTVTDKRTISISKPDGGTDKYTVRTKRQVVCKKCMGVGTIIDQECNGTGLMQCPTCLGTGKLVSFPVLVATFIPRTDYWVMNPTALPDRKIYRPKGWFRKERLSGIMLVDRTGIDLGEIPYVNDAVNTTAERFCIMNMGDDESRLRRRTLNISFMPVTQAGYTRKRSSGTLCVYGNNKEVYRDGRLPLHLRNVLIAALSSLAVISAAAYLISSYL